MCCSTVTVPWSTSSPRMSGRRQLADQMVQEAEALIGSINGFADADTCAVHWNDCDMDERSFWFHFRPRLQTRYGSDPVLPGSCKRNGARVISRWKMRIKKLADTHGYQLGIDRVFSPTEHKYGPGIYDRVLRVAPAYWCYRITFYGGPDGVVIPSRK